MCCSERMFLGKERSDCSLLLILLMAAPPACPLSLLGQPGMGILIIMLKLGKEKRSCCSPRCLAKLGDTSCTL